MGCTGILESIPFVGWPISGVAICEIVSILGTWAVIKGRPPDPLQERGGAKIGILIFIWPTRAGHIARAVAPDAPKERQKK